MPRAAPWQSAQPSSFSVQGGSQDLDTVQLQQTVQTPNSFSGTVHLEGQYVHLKLLAAGWGFSFLVDETGLKQVLAVEGIRTAHGERCLGLLGTASSCRSADPALVRLKGCWDIGHDGLSWLVLSRVWEPHGHVRRITSFLGRPALQAIVRLQGNRPSFQMCGVPKVQMPYQPWRFRHQQRSKRVRDSQVQGLCSSFHGCPGVPGSHLERKQRVKRSRAGVGR